MSNPEEDKIRDMVDSFADKMKEKLIKKYRDGNIGWDDPACINALKYGLIEHIDKGDPVDVANFCAILSYHGAKTNV